MNKKKKISIGLTPTHRANERFHRQLKRRVDAGDLVEVILIKDKFCLPKGARLKILKIYDDPGYSAVVQLLDHWRELYKWYDLPVNVMGDRQCSTTTEVMYKRGPNEWITNLYFDRYDRIFEPVGEDRNDVRRLYAREETDKDYIRWLEDQIFEARPENRFIEAFDEYLLKKRTFLPKVITDEWKESMLDRAPHRRLEDLEEEYEAAVERADILDAGFRAAVEKVVILELELEEMSKRDTWLKLENDILNKRINGLSERIEELENDNLYLISKSKDDRRTGSV